MKLNNIDNLPERIEIARRAATRPNNPSDDYLLNEPCIVLVYLPHNDGTPFVTWQEGMNQSTFWGHYFGNLRDALADFDTR